MIASDVCSEIVRLAYQVSGIIAGTGGLVVGLLLGLFVGYRAAKT